MRRGLVSADVQDLNQRHELRIADQSLRITLSDERRYEILAGLFAPVGDDGPDIVRLLHSRPSAVELLVKRGAWVESAHLPGGLPGNGFTLIRRQANQVPDYFRGEQ